MIGEWVGFGKLLIWVVFNEWCGGRGGIIGTGDFSVIFGGEIDVCLDSKI